MGVITTGLTITSSYGSWYLGELPLRADSGTVHQFVTDKGYGSATSYTGDESRFSNAGGRMMNYYGSIVEVIDTTGGTATRYHWINIFGYDSIVTSITTA